MACDMFASSDTLELLKGKSVYIFGSSNMRGLYKDLIWLLENGSLIPQTHLKAKNEVSYANDVRISHGELHRGRDYEEVREYPKDPYLLFQFITRLYLPSFINTIKNLNAKPDVLIISSSIWDLSRWGPDGVDQFKRNLFETFRFLKAELPSTRIIWPTTLPPAFACRGGFLTTDIEFMRGMLPWHVIHANKHVSELANFFKIDVLDFHYHFRFLMNYHVQDGIHWNPTAVRYATNLLLTHIALIWDHKLPRRYELDQWFVERPQRINDSASEQGECDYRNNKWINIGN